MKYIFLLLCVLLICSMALDITTPGDIFGTLGASHTGDVNIGTLSAFTPSSVFNLTSSSTISGTVTLGSNGILTSTPVLYLVQGNSLTCPLFVLNGGSLAGRGILSVSGNLEINAATTIGNVVAAQTCVTNQAVTVTGGLVINSGAQINGDLTSGSGSMVEFMGAVSGASTITAHGEMVLSSGSKAVVSTPITIAQTGTLTATGNIKLEGDLSIDTKFQVSEGANVTIGSSISATSFTALINVSGTLIFKPDNLGIGIDTHVGSIGSGKIIVAGETTFSGYVHVLSEMSVESTATFLKAVGIEKNKVLRIASGGEAVFQKSFFQLGNLLVQGICRLYTSDSEAIVVGVSVVVSSTGKLSVEAQTTFNETLQVANMEISSNATFNKEINCTGKISVLENGSAEVNGGLLGSGDLNVQGKLTFNNEATVTPNIIVSGPSQLIVAGETIFTGLVNASSGILISGNASFFNMASCAENKVIHVAEQSRAMFFNSITGNGKLLVEGTCVFDPLQQGIQVDADVTVAETGHLFVTGQPIFNGEVEVRSQISIAAMASFNKAVRCAKDKAIYIAEGASAIFSQPISGEGYIAVEGTCSFDTKGQITTKVAVNTQGKVVCSGYNLLTGTISLGGSMKVEQGANTTIGASMSGKGTLSVHGNLLFDSQKSLNVSNLVVEANGTAACKAKASFSNITLKASSSFAVEGSSSSTGLSSMGSLTIGSVGSLSVQGPATLSSGSTYLIKPSSISSTNYLDVSGEVTLGGNLVIETSIDFTSSTKLTVISYGSRASSSTFSSLTINQKSKREIQEDEYEVIYESDRAYVQKISSDTTSSDNNSGHLLFLSLALLLSVLF